tara:strand:- start:188 stop:556 length:369 start_codon:yes stop_codon:yes gene_type:complete
MADLKIPNINMNSNKYIFKKKLSLRMKSKSRLFTEAVLLFILSLLLVYLNYLIPNKYLLLKNLPTSLNKSFILAMDLFLNLCQVSLVIFIFFSSFISLILMIGSVYRLFRVVKRKSKQIIYK